MKQHLSTCIYGVYVYTSLVESSTQMYVCI
jgi:hypothetical protein